MYRFCAFIILSTLVFSLRAQKEVANLSELIKAVAEASPGDRIILKDGRYQGSEIILKANGEDQKPITIQAGSRGKVFFESPVLIEGDYIHLNGIQFVEEGNLRIKGTGSRVSHCNWDDSKAKVWLRVNAGSSKVEIDHNTFQNKLYSNTTFEKGCPLLRVDVRNKNEQHHIHHNLFKNVAEGKVSNGYETIQIITENNPFDPPEGHANTLIEDNLFLKCNGEAEVISMKSNGNILRRNTFRACKGGLVLRHGDDNVVMQNYFFGDGEKSSYGVRIQGSGQVVANNYFENLGNYGLGMMDGTPDDLYVRFEDALIAFNTFINCKDPFMIGLNHSLHPNGTAPKDCRIIGNIFYSDKQEISKKTIVYVQNDQPEGWIWRDNYSTGGNVPESAGIITSDPNLKKARSGLMVATKQTPNSDDKIGSDGSLENDLFGNKRSINKTIGAIQFPVKFDNNKPLDEGDLIK